MKWRILKINDNNVEIVADRNVLSNDGTTGLWLGNQDGFLNSHTILDTLCKRLYSSSYGTVRCITPDDIFTLIGFVLTVETSGFPDNFGETQEYTSGGEMYNPSTNTFEYPSTENPISLTSNNYKILDPEGLLTNYDIFFEDAREDVYLGVSNEKRNYSKQFWIDQRTFYFEYR